MTPDPSAKDPAKSRFLVLQVMRLSGAVLAIFGLSILAGKIDLPRIAGVALFLVGLFDLLVFPMILIKRWKTPTT